MREYWICYVSSPLLGMAVGWVVNNAGTAHTDMELTTKNGSQMHARDQKHHRRCEVKVQGSGDLVQKT